MNKVRSYDRFRESWRARHEPGAIRMLSVLYWRVLLLCATIVFLVLIVFGVLELRSTLATLDKINDPQPNQAPIITRPEVDDAVAAFDARQAAYDARKANPFTTADPSK